PELPASTMDRIAELYRERDRKSTRLNSSHLVISYAVFCLKKKTEKGVPSEALIGRDREQAEIALAGRPRRVVAVNCRGDAFPREQGQDDIGNFHRSLNSQRLGWIPCVLRDARFASSSSAQRHPEEVRSAVSKD